MLKTAAAGVDLLSSASNRLTVSSKVTLIRPSAIFNCLSSLPSLNKSGTDNNGGSLGEASVLLYVRKF